MAKYNNIQPLSFEIIPEAEGLQVKYERLALPTGFKEDALRDFQRRKPKAKSLPIDDLNRLVRLILPDVYSIDSYANRAGRNWLRASPNSIDPRAIRIILNAWMNAHQIDTNAPSTDDLQWKPEITQLDNWRQYPNGTAEAGDGAIWDLLPNLLAKRIVGQAIEVGNYPLHFHQVAKDPSSKGVELMSWPPLEHKDYKKRSWFYSYYLQIAIATVPFMSTPQINVYGGIRRWVSTYRSYLPRERLSVYIRAELPYLSGIQSSHNFQVATAKIYPHQDGEWRLRWSDRLPEMLDFLNLNPPLPDPEQLRKSPVDPLKRQELPNIALVYSNKMNSPTHEVAPGISPKDRHDLLEAIKPLWEDVLTLTATRKKVEKRPKGWKDTFHEKKEVNYQERRARLHQQHKKYPIAIEIHYQNDISRDAMLDTLAELLGLNTPLCGTHDLDGLSLIISTRRLGAIGAELRRTEGDNLRDVVEKRRQSTVTELGKIAMTTISLVEILGKDQYEKKTDPKKALRFAFAQSGRLTQFFNPMSTKEIKNYLPNNENEDSENASDNGSKEEPPHRFKSAALDALRQLGVHTAGRLGERGQWLLNGWEWHAAGYWLVRQSRKKSTTSQQRFLPTLVFIDGKTGEVSAWVNGLEEMRPYHEVLLLVGQGLAKTLNQQKDVATRLPQDIDRLGFNEDIVLVVDTTQSSMRYKIWRWLQDSKMSLDEIEFNNGQKLYPQDRSNLRVVRTRYVKHETPEWYAKNKTVGLTAGLHKVNERVFGSISSTARTQKFKRNLTKTNTADASTSTPSPGFYELTVGMMQTHDNAEEVATIVHDLRDASSQYTDETAHALPLHLGKLIEEYLLWIDEDEEDEDNEA